MKNETWNSLGLSSETLDLIHQAGFSSPTPVQAMTIPVALNRKDLIVSAQTGTGKTASFVLPLTELLTGREGTYGLILAPTREIAQQIQQTLTVFGAPRGVRSAVLIGGVDYKHDLQALQSYPQVIVATPGRLCDHLDRGSLWLDFIELVILDEADRMLDMGFSAQLSRIMDEVPQKRQTMLFSATFSPQVERLAKKILHNPEIINAGKPRAAAEGVDQRIIWMLEDEKMRVLRRIIRDEKGSMIVFLRSKENATRVWRSLHSAGFYEATYIHSDRLQSHREQALAEFKEGKYRVLIATDVAARGLHIDDVGHVINYDLPIEPESYIHRIGRTGRAGATGQAITFATHRDLPMIKTIERVLGTMIPDEKTEAFSQNQNRPRSPHPIRDKGEKGRGRRR